MKSAGKARNNGLYRHIRTSKEIIRNLLNDYYKFLYIVLSPFSQSYNVLYISLALYLMYFILSNNCLQCIVYFFV